LKDINNMIIGSSRCHEDLEDYKRAHMEIGIVLQPPNPQIALKNEFR